MPSQHHTHFLSGDDTLLVQEARDLVIKSAQATDLVTRHILNIDKTTDWQKLTSLTQNRGLFSDKQIIDLRNPSAKFDKHAQQILTDYLQNPSPDVTLIISSGKLTSAQKKAKWFSAIEKKMAVTIIWPLKSRDLPQWITQRLKKHTLRADSDSIKQLIELTEGNLLAANQAIEKLALLYTNQLITTKEMLLVIHDSAQFNVFDLSNYALLGHTERVIRIIDGIRAEGGEPTLVLWALTREIRELYNLLFEMGRGVSSSQLLAKQWASRKPLLQQAMRRLSLKQLSALLKKSHQADLIIKGAASGNAWNLLTDIATGLTAPQTV